MPSFGGVFLIVVVLIQSHHFHSIMLCFGCINEIIVENNGVNYNVIDIHILLDTGPKLLSLKKSNPFSTMEKGISPYLNFRYPIVLANAC